jgi:hypothetical protein
VSPEPQRVNRIFPRNLTAQASYNVPGNPPSTRPESGVSNCFPGLEYDHRNFERRFFPGLVVEYVSQADASPESLLRQGARIVDVQTSDPALTQPRPDQADQARALRSSLAQFAQQLAAQPWFLVSVTQGGTTIELVDDTGANLDGLVVWRLVRNLRPEPVTIVVGQRKTGDDDPPPNVTFAGWRRNYTDASTGVIDLSFQPGELTQSLCSPWQHDFRDCSCTYWASNHPDIVLPAVPLGQATLPSGNPAEPDPGEPRVDWLRDPDFGELHPWALPSQGANRRFEMSYFQINRQWQDLAVVLEGREIDAMYVPRSRSRDWATPFASDEELWERIRVLAGLEHLVALLYLYALFSVVDPDEARKRGGRPNKWPMLPDDAAFTRSILIEIATGEMQHLRWANHLLWGLADAVDLPFQPAVVPPSLVIPSPTGGDPQPAVLSPLTAATLQLFVDIEQSSAYIDGQYARVTATLRRPRYPKHLYQLASNVAEEGEEHFLHFRDLQRVLKPYGDNAPVYLRTVTPGDPADAEVAAALAIYRQITDALTVGYQPGDIQNQASLADARKLMFDLQARAEALAKAGKGVPFLSVWQ